MAKLEYNSCTNKKVKKLLKVSPIDESLLKLYHKERVEYLVNNPDSNRKLSVEERSII